MFDRHGLHEFFRMARSGAVYSLGGVLLIAMVGAVGLRHAQAPAAHQDERVIDAVPSVTAAARPGATSAGTPRTFHEMERPHPLRLLTPEPVSLSPQARQASARPADEAE